MDYTITNFGKYAKRRNYTKHPLNYDNYSNLLEVQIDKYQKIFSVRLEEIFQDYLNINLYENRGKNIIDEKEILASIKYKGFDIGEPRRTLKDSILYNKNYEIPIYVRLEFLDNKYGIQIPEQSIYLFDFPLMLEDGSFVINGSYKVIVPQIIRSNGIYFNKNINFELQKNTYTATILPSVGLWIIFDFVVKTRDNNNYVSVLYLRIDQNKRINFVCFLKSLGMTNELLFMFFNNAKWLKNSIASENTSYIFDNKYIAVIKNIIGKYTRDIPDNREQLNKIEIINIFDNEIYLYIPIHSSIYQKVYDSLSLIEDEMNNEIGLYYSLNIVSSKQLKNNDELNTYNLMSEKRIKFANIKHSLSNVEGLPSNLISAILKDNAKSFDNYNFDDLPKISNLSASLIRMLTKSLAQYRQKINWITNFLLNFNNYSKEMQEYIENKYVNNFVLEKVYYSKKEKNNNYEYNKAIRIFYSSLKPGDPFPKYNSEKFIDNLFSDPKKYSITDAGLVSLKNKLAVAHRIYKKTLANDILSKNGKILFKAGTYVNREILGEIESLINKDHFKKQAKLLNGTDIYWDEIYIQDENDSAKKIKIIGVNKCEKHTTLSVSYLVACINYLINIRNDIGYVDDIDSLEKRRIKSIDEIFGDIIKTNMIKLLKNVYDTYFRELKGNTIPKLERLLSKMISSKNCSIAIREFVNISQLSQFLDQTNPLSNLSNKRRITALGPGGLNKDRAGLDVRDVHATHFGRICPIETPEGPNIGLISNLACFSKVDDNGFLLSPYYKVKNGIVDSSKIHYLSVADERDKFITESTVKIDNNGKLLSPKSFCRFNNNPEIVDTNKVDYICSSSNQIISIATGLIPFLENDDSNRTLMGANMQRQAVPLLTSEAPYVGTGIEHLIAKDSNLCRRAECSGKVTKINSSYVDILNKKTKKVERHNLKFYEKTNQNTVLVQKPLVKIGDIVNKNDIIADNPSICNGELALGKNLLVAFTTFYGYNYEDAIIISERLVKDDTLTSIKVEEIKFEVLRTKLGPEEVTYDIPFVSNEAKSKLDENGIVNIGSYVKEGDVLVGKITPKAAVKNQPEIELLNQIFGQKAKNIKNSSLVASVGLNGVVIDVKTIDAEDCEGELPDNCIKIIKLYIATKRKIQAGDKLAGRHGNKGVISVVLPEENMPFLKDGRRVDVILNPLGVPSRMNIGQILELQLGHACHELKEMIVCPPFKGLSYDEIKKISKEAGLPEDGKTFLYNGYTGEKFCERISIGYMYMLKLNHMVEDKIHSRCTGNYSLITQQPLGGKSQKGGQRFGEMEVWALEGYGAAHLLQEMLTIKSDDIFGRIKSYENIIRGVDVETPQLPASIKVLFNEIKAIGLKIDISVDYDKKSEIFAQNYSDFMQQRSEKGFNVEANEKKDEIKNNESEGKEE